MKYEQFIRKIQIIKEKKIQNSQIENLLENLFFYRQIYSPPDEAYYPDIEPTCFCNKIFNPDKPFITCRECKELLHTECYVLSKNTGNSSCWKCSNNIDLQLQHLGIAISDKANNYNSYFIKNSKNNQINLDNPTLIGIKRTRADSIEEKIKSIPKNNLPETNILNNIVEKIEHSNISLNYENDKKIHEEKVNYPNLSEERRKFLTSLIEKLEKATNTDFHDKSISTEERSRRTFRNKISYALVNFLLKIF